MPTKSTVHAVIGKMVQEETRTQGLAPPLLENPIQKLLDYLKGDSPRTIIGLVGLPGAGKSTLAAQLGEAVNASAGADAMMVLGMDGFHLPKAKLRQFPDWEAAFRRRGAPWTFDPIALADRLEQIRNSAGRHTVLWPDFQHGVGDPVDDVLPVQPQTRLVLVEGLYLLHEKDGWGSVSSYFDAFWYLDTPLETALERLTQRHLNAWKSTREEVEKRIDSNDRLNAEIVAKTRERANWRLRDNFFSGVDFEPRS